jgi:serine phosphatase RsbU (regulator of sigma subunit)/CheY-like chemotaxis protein
LADTELEGATARDQDAELSSAEALPILVVDDRPENLRTLEAVLSPLGYPLQTATSGRQALRLLLEHDFGLILLDVRMPGLDGLQTAELIKGRSKSRDIPIVFLTAARDEVGDIIRGYGIGAVDYVLKPFDAELLRSKVAVFAELETSRRALKRSEALLRGAFEAAPIGKTVLNAQRLIVRSNPAFARLVGRDPEALIGTAIDELCVPEDRAALIAALDGLAPTGPELAVDAPPSEPRTATVDLRLQTASDAHMWVSLVGSMIDPGESGQSLLLAQWVDLSVRRRAEQARAELLLEQAARVQAESIAERLGKLHALSAEIETLPLDDLVEVLAVRLAALFDAEGAELTLRGELVEPLIVRAIGREARRIDPREESGLDGPSFEEPLLFEGTAFGRLRLLLPSGRVLNVDEKSLLRDAAERIALAARRAQLYEEEHRIAVVLQRGLLPKSLPTVAGVELAAHYEAAGVGAEVGGDWYDAFTLPGGRLGIVVGDVAGRSIPAASAMGQLRTVTRTFALWDDGSLTPGEVLTRLNRHELNADESQMFTIVYAVLDPAQQTISWAAAGHLPPLIRSESRATRYLERGGGLLGINDATYETFREPLRSDETLVLYTDGLVERRGEALDAGLDRLALAVANGPDSPGALAEHVLGAVIPQDERLNDDVTALVARIS